jgi:hypothetical protein
MHDPFHLGAQKFAGRRCTGGGDREETVVRKEVDPVFAGEAQIGADDKSDRGRKDFPNRGRERGRRRRSPASGGNSPVNRFAVGERSAAVRRRA